MTRIGDRLSRARGQRFVGRSGELELFRSALVAPEPAFAVLFIHGPGGVGKTALLSAFARLADELGIPAGQVDMRAVDPSPAAFTAAAAEALGVAAGALAGGSAEGRRVLLIDTYEQASHLDGWLRETFLPELSVAVTVVIAGRQPPAPAWRADPGWHELLRVISLRNLRPDESLEYLAIEGLDERVRKRVLGLTYGHPLAMSLYVAVLAQGGTGVESSTAPELHDAPDIVSTLLRSFLGGAPSEQHRAALGVASRVRYTDEGVLAAALDGGRAPELLEWLRSLSFVEQDAFGVFPHDLAREVLDADLRWRDRTAFETLHHRARAHILDRVRRSEGAVQQRAAVDLAFLHRSNPVMSSFLNWSTLGSTHADPLRSADVPEVLALIERFQGSEQAGLAERWISLQPEGFIVVRDGQGDSLSAAGMLRLDRAAVADIEADPGTAAAWWYAHRERPPREHEAFTVARFFVDRESYQAVPSYTLNTVSVWHSQHIITTASMAWDFVIAFERPETVEQLFSYIFFDRMPEADYEVGGRRYGAFGHDWRVMDVASWLDATGRQEVSDEAPPPRSGVLDPSRVALSQPEFAAAVRAALRDLHRPERLAQNPLVRSRVVTGGDSSGSGDPGDVLREALHHAADALRSHPRDEKLHRVLDRTYLRPAPTQEAAMELLDLPPTTYRRHLGQAVERVAEWLWQRDLYGSP
ncbi:MAG TPA: AAA family ATPase [Acidimicrobiales bacterium]|nr:AAA family ATPase [Acidimicrobiales bacterium]